MVKSFSIKKIGYYTLNPDSIFKETSIDEIKDFIKILYLKKGSEIILDFNAHQCKSNSLFFISPSQFYQFPENKLNEGIVLYFNRDFYCVEIHDKEVSCDGILYNNIFKVAQLILPPNEMMAFDNILEEIKSEFENEDTGLEEMLRLLLKRIIIKLTRLYKKQNHLQPDNIEKDNLDFLRKYSALVEKEYFRKHSVSGYAEMLNITPKNLHKKIKIISDKTPNELIKNRLLLEAKRYLAHSELSSKEIAYKLGYDDEAYFSRFFNKQSGNTPIQFRKLYRTKKRGKSTV